MQSTSWETLDWKKSHLEPYLTLRIYTKNTIQIYCASTIQKHLCGTEAYMQVRKQQLELDMEQQTGSK